MGAGLSIPAALPSWGDLVARMIVGWEVSQKLLDPDMQVSAEKTRAADRAAIAVGELFEDDLLATVLYLRGLIEAKNEDTKLKSNGTLSPQAVTQKQESNGFPKSLADLIY